MYAPFNRFNAELSLVSVYEVLSKRNPDWDFDTLYTQSVRWADIANGSAGKSNRPIGLSSGGTPAMRTLAQTSFGLMSFTNAAIGNWMRWIKKSQSELFSKDERKGSRKALAQAAGNADKADVIALTSLINAANNRCEPTDSNVGKGAEMIFVHSS